MDNQHRKIDGYRELSQGEIDSINEVKSIGRRIGLQIDELESGGLADKRWLAIAKTDLQRGLMALTRSIARPDFF